MPILIEFVTEADVHAYRNGALDERRSKELREAARFDARLARLIRDETIDEGFDRDGDRHP